MTREVAWAWARVGARGSVAIAAALLAALFAVRSAGPRAAAGQEPPPDTVTFTLTGQILDGITHTPVVAAVIKVPALARFTFTDVNGRFHFPDFPEGTWEVIVEHLGYNTAEGTVAVAEGNGLFLRMTPDPVALEGLLVRPRSQRLLAQRRQRFPFRITRISPQVIMSSINADPAAIFRRNSLSHITGCPGPTAPTDWMTPDCVRKRGRLARIRVFLDEFPMAGGMLHLSAMPREQIHSMDWIPETAELRVYTRVFIERLDKGDFGVAPLIW